MISSLSNVWERERELAGPDALCLYTDFFSFGTVILVRHRATGRLYAQKQLKKATLVVHKKIVEQTRTERAILETIRHPFVVKLYYAFQDKEKLYLLLEYVEGDLWGLRRERH